MQTAGLLQGRSAASRPSPGLQRHAGGLPQRRRGLLVSTRADRKGRGDKQDRPDDKADAKKADFSAYWSLKFRNFFSKRRDYLEQAAKPQGPPPAVARLEEQIAAVRAQMAEQQGRNAEAAARLQADIDELEAEKRRHSEQMAAQLAPRFAATQQRLDRALDALQQRLPGWDSQAPPQGPLEVVLDDVDLARRQIQQRRMKVTTLGVAQFRAALAAAVMAPFTLPAALHARWRALFTGRRYENFLMSEGERVWGWRNRMENERWFWEVWLLDRFLLHLLFVLCWMIVVPDNIIWAVLVPYSACTWIDGRPPMPWHMDWWLIMVLGLYGKCWPQVQAAARWVLQWA